MSKEERYAEHTVAWELPNGDSVTKSNYNLADIETKYIPIQTEVICDDKDKTISDLETKLAESEENNKLLEMQLQDMERSKLSWENQYFTLYNTLKNYREVTEKKHLLDEKEWQDYCAFKHIEPQIKGCLDREKEYEKQLAEKEKEYQSFKKIADENVNYLKNRILEETRNYNQDKISFAVEQLTLFKNTIVNKMNNPYSVNIKHILSDFDNQIKQLNEQNDV